MPRLNRNLAAARAADIRAGVYQSLSDSHGSIVKIAKLPPPLRRQERIHRFQVAVALAYWGICLLLLLSVLVLAWLDVRETARLFALERGRLGRDAAEELRRSAERREHDAQK